MTLILPMFAMVLLTTTVLFGLFRARFQSVADGRVDASHFLTYTVSQEPDKSIRLARHYENLFEAPTLFYAACITAMVVQRADGLMVGLAWAYVAFRAAHAYIHTGTNRLLPRIYAYFGGWAVMLSMWLKLVWSVATSTSP